METKYRVTEEEKRRKEAEMIKLMVNTAILELIEKKAGL